MMKKRLYSPSNSIVFISDLDGGVSPDPVWGATILATSSCVSVACFPEIDGPTELFLGRVGEVDPGYAAEFEGLLETPDKYIVLTEVDLSVILKTAVPGVITRLKIWRSHPQWPEQVFIGWAEA